MGSLWVSVGSAGVNLGSVWLCFLKKPNKDGHSLASFFQKNIFLSAGARSQKPEFEGWARAFLG
jgi:hypothetical protein